MHEIELKARLTNPERTEQQLSRIADFAFHCVKTDCYWSFGKKTLRIRREQTAGKETVFVTHKLKKYTGAIETNRELEFELPVTAVPVFTAMLENLGFICTAKKQKDTKVFIPRSGLFKEETLAGSKALSIELSVIEPIGTFLEIEVLYQNEGAVDERHIHNARTIFDTILTVLEIPQSAIEPRPYNELLADKASSKS